VEPSAQEIVVVAAISEKIPEKAATDAAAPAVRGQVETFLENWRAAWERGEVEAYMSFYGDRAAQGDRRGLEAIRDHKRSLWTERPPKTVRLEDMRVTERKNGWRVEFVQQYESKDGFADKGMKRMVLVKAGPRIIIVDEQWSAL
jgi:murein L,D-transpeptidase YafK